MEVYMLMNESTKEPTIGFLTREEAERKAIPGEWVCGPIAIESPMELVKRYYYYRGLEMPQDEFHALAFLQSELGELADALVSSAGKWVRNNPDKDRDPYLEAGDVLMMLYVTLHLRGIDPILGMMDKFKLKGFTDDDLHSSHQVSAQE